MIAAPKDLLADDGAIVITGVALEAPGGATSLATLWGTLSGHADALGPLPRDRGWDVEGLLRLGDAPGWGRIPDSCGLIPGATMWDPAAFGVSPREAALIDPHQRVAVRCAFRAFQAAGLRPGDHRLRDAGVAFAALHDDYGPRFGVPGEYHGDLLVGVSASTISGRISNALDIRGPSVTIDAGCAGALTAIDHAAAMIRSGAAPTMIAGGVSVLCSPGMLVEFSRLGALAANGRCRPFGKEDRGVVWSEGSAAFLLETAGSARGGGRTPIAVVHASASTHGGGRSPMHVPDRDAREEAIRRCLDISGLGYDDVDVVEAHGTGTRAGDPVELAALGATYGAAAAADGRRIPIRSAKSHLGHAQAAASGLGLCALMAGAREGSIPRHLLEGEPSDAIDWAGSGLALAGEEPWPARGGWRTAGISALGISGTVTHALVGFPEEGRS